MRTRAGRAILWRMDDTGHDRRKSATANAALLLAAALIPLLGAIDATSIDHTQLRPWGCRTCSIPAEPVPAADQDPDVL